MSSRHGPPKHQNQFAWIPNAGRKINETEPGGKFRPLSEITGVCPRCKEQIDWKRRYGKYKPLKEPAKCQRCSKRTVRQAYHNLCSACAKDQNVCAKCCCSVGQIIGRGSEEVEVEQKMLEEAIKNARERDRRTLLRAMNKGKSKNSAKAPSNEGNKVGDLFPSASLEEYAAKTRDHNLKVDGRHDRDEDEDEDDDDSGSYGDNDENDGDKSEDDGVYNGDGDNKEPVEAENGDKGENKYEDESEDEDGDKGRERFCN